MQDIIRYEREAKLAQESLLATKRVRDSLLSEFEAQPIERDTSKAVSKLPDSMQSLTQQLDAVLSMVRDGKYNDNNKLVGTMRNRKQASPASPTLLQGPSRFGGDRPSDPPVFSPVEYDVGIYDDNFVPADMYADFEALMNRRPTLDKEGGAVAARRPAVKLPKMQGPPVRRPRADSGESSVPDYDIELDEPLPDETFRLNKGGRLVTGVFRQEYVRNYSR